MALFKGYNELDGDQKPIRDYKKFRERPSKIVGMGEVKEH